MLIEQNIVMVKMKGGPKSVGTGYSGGSIDGGGSGGKRRGLRKWGTITTQICL